MSGIKRANPAFVVSTNNTRVVPNRRNATLEEIEAFKKDLVNQKKTKEPTPKKAKSEDKS
jgi:hypothetical protein